MAIEGTFTHGVVVLDDSQALPEGTRVQIVVASGKQQTEQPKREPTLLGLVKFAGTVNDLPADMAEQHDHYIHGTPRR